MQSVEEDDGSLDAKSVSSSGNPWRHVQTLLWSDLQAVIKAPEQPVVRAVIGSTLIEENEQLFLEADALEQILHGIEEETQKRLSSHRLFDTPARLLLEREIQLLLQALQRSSNPAEELQGLGAAPGSVVAQPIEPARRRGSGAAAAVKQVRDDRVSPRETGSVASSVGMLNFGHLESPEVLEPAKVGQFAESPSDKRVVSYVIGKSTWQERANSGLPSDGWTSRTNSSRSPSSNPSSSRSSQLESMMCRASSGLSTRSCNNALVLDCVKPYLNYNDIDVVADKIRHALASERIVLAEDVAYLRECLEKSAELYSCVKNAPPSLSELKDCGRNLERRLHSETQLSRVNKALGSRGAKQPSSTSLHRVADMKRPLLPSLSLAPKPEVPPPVPVLGKASVPLPFRRASLGTGQSGNEPNRARDMHRRRSSCGDK